MENENKIKSTNGGVKNKNVETYAKDMAKVIEGSEGGIIKKIIHSTMFYFRISTKFRGVNIRQFSSNDFERIVSVMNIMADAIV